MELSNNFLNYSVDFISLATTYINYSVDFVCLAATYMIAININGKNAILRMIASSETNLDCFFFKLQCGFRILSHNLYKLFLNICYIFFQ
jgi:hypothetical protein